MSSRMHLVNAMFPDDLLKLEGLHLNHAISRQLGYSEGQDFSSDITLVMSLALPEPTERFEDWVHTEFGPRGRWIVRLIRFYRAERPQPWRSKELYMVDSDEQSVSMATAYGRAWLFSHATWPPAQEKDGYPLAS